MAWQSTAHGGKYYYLSVRVPGRPNPVKLYLGTGEAARRAAECVAARREHRTQARQAVDDLTARFAETDRLALELVGWTTALLAAAMTAAGFRKHHGTWRRGKAMAKANDVECDQAQADDELTECDRPGWKPNLNYARETVKAIARQVREGNANAAARLPGWLAMFPELLAEVAGLAERAEAAWLAAATGGDPVETQALKGQAATLRAALRGSKPSPTVAILADEVVLAELAARHAEIVSAGLPAHSPVAAMWLKRAESAQRRLRAAVTAMARVRAIEQPPAPTPAPARGRGASTRAPAAARRQPSSARRSTR